MVTQDLRQMGSREYAILASMFRYLAAHPDTFDLTEGSVVVHFNLETGEVFLASQESGDFWVPVDGELVRWGICEVCEEEADDLGEDGVCGTCRAWGAQNEGGDEEGGT